MRSLGRALIGLGLVGLVVGLLSLALILSSDFADLRGLFAASTLVVGWSFLGTGLFAWWRRPANRTGALMTATGFAWFLQAMTASGNEWVFTAGFAVNPFAYGLLIHMLVAFPEGRLTTRLQRRVVGLSWFVVTVMQFVLIPFIDPADFAPCDGCPDNALLVAGDKAVVDAIIGVQTVLAVIALVGVVVLLVRRYRSTPPAQRRTLGPVLWAGGLGMIATAVQLAVGASGAETGVAQALYVASIAVLASVPWAFLFGLRRSRFTRAGAVSELVARLGEGPERRGRLRDALADALGDPTLELAYWIPDREIYVDAEGASVELPRRGSGRAAAAVERDGALLGAIVHDNSLSEERELVSAASAAAALAIENERLDAELRARVEELRRSRERLIEVGLAERRALERNLHDGAQQRLVALALSLRLARGMVDEDPGGAGEMLDEAQLELAEATAELRELARGIHPAVLSDRGLSAALEALAGRAPLPVEILETPAERLPAVVEAAAYYVVAEALTNVARYARAEHAEVRITRENGRVTVLVADDGVGGADPVGGTGLQGLADRIAALDGRLEVESPPGGGTTVRARIPVS
jgi:signal transduction histidine kinase